MLLVFDVEVVEDFLLLGLGEGRVAELGVEFALPNLDLVVLLADQLNQVLVLIHEVGVLGQQQLDLLLQVVDLLSPTDLENQLFVHSYQFRLQLTHSSAPVIFS